MKHIISIVLAISLVIAGISQPASAQESTTQLPARPGNSPGACLLPTGTWSFPVDQLFPPYLAIDKCRDADGSWFTAGQYDSLRTGRDAFVLPDVQVHGLGGAQNAGLPDDWYDVPAECAWLPSTRGNGKNLLLDVQILDGTELLTQGIYDSSSNEPTGIAGLFLGIALTNARAIRYLYDWRYELQDECQTIRSRRQIDKIESSLAGLENVGSIADGVATTVAQSADNGRAIDSVSGRVDDMRAVVDETLSQAARTLGQAEGISERVDNLANNVDRQMNEHAAEVRVGLEGTQTSLGELRIVLDEMKVVGDETLSRAALTLSEAEGITERVEGLANNVDRQLLELTDETSAALADIATLRGETADVRDDVQALRDEVDADSRQEVDLVIEENLRSCTVLATFLIDDGPGLQSETFAFVGSLVEVFGDSAPTIAITKYERAVERRDTSPRQAYQDLCSTYKHLARG